MMTYLEAGRPIGHGINTVAPAGTLPWYCEHREQLGVDSDWPTVGGLLDSHTKKLFKRVSATLVMNKLTLR